MHKITGLLVGVLSVAVFAHLAIANTSKIASTKKNCHTLHVGFPKFWLASIKVTNNENCDGLIKITNRAWVQMTFSVSTDAEVSIDLLNTISSTFIMNFFEFDMPPHDQGISCGGGFPFVPPTCNLCKGAKANC